ncbi:hypothetical protein [Streptomyces solicathayae]|uniref:Uncharacterized protein n=1 Tax=Streptomyces solicathayae TaxID=3081768 RepID=A0ABZ0LT55_9ACTN|nr:hypothetical protein [Streptomyces sp. HUAS YS2]WOX22530.1 hypothetical protein R2D22_14435 [Streptomyces sp. HUAS YS2]
MRRQRDPRETPAGTEPTGRSAAAGHSVSSRDRSSDPSEDPFRTPFADRIADALAVPSARPPKGAPYAARADARPSGEPADPREAAAVDAFRRARDAGEHRTRRTRRRDDWRPVTVRRRSAFPVRAAGLGIAVTVLLGGVAVAAGTGVLPTPFAPRPETPSPSPVPSRSAGGQPEDGGPGRDGTPPGRLDPELSPAAGRPKPPRPSAARDEEGHCRSYLAAQRRKGEAPDGTAYERLEEAAGGPRRVAAYCAPLLAEAEKDRGNPRSRKP